MGNRPSSLPPTPSLIGMREGEEDTATGSLPRDSSGLPLSHSDEGGGWGEGETGGAVAIIDYGVGNLRSVQKAFEAQGHTAVITRDVDAIRAAPRVLLPGVGAFGAAANTLREVGLESVAIEAAHSGKPFLGICVGMQLLFTGSEEMGTHRGLDLIPGRVLRFDERNLGDAARGFKVPQIGWNALHFPDANRPRSPIFAGLDENAEVYFVHSYFCRPEDDVRFTAARTDFIAPYTSAVWNGANVYGTQFHPEKSGDVGLRILDNFAKL